jgi:hypothetical protein
MRMRDIMLLVEQTIPGYSGYGYWICPDGQIVPCSMMTHGEAAAAQLGIAYSDEDSEEERAIVQRGIDEGGVRVVAQKGSDEFSAEWGEMSITTDARKSLISLMSLYQERDAYILGDEWFNNFKDALRYIRG